MFATNTQASLSDASGFACAGLTSSSLTALDTIHFSALPASLHDASHDALHSLAGGVRRSGDRNNNLLRGTSGNDVLQGKQGNDTLVGKGGADRLLGDIGRDRLVGGTGNDILNGGGGRDRLTGGAGRDRFILNAKWSSRVASAVATITDFTDGQDQLQLVGLTVDQLTFQQGQGSQANNTILKHTPTDKVLAVLQGVNLATTPTANDQTDSIPSASPTPSPTPVPGSEPAPSPIPNPTPSPVPSPIPNPTPSPTPVPVLGTGTLAFSTTNYRVKEGVGLATITVTRNGGSTGEISVTYGTSNNTALAGQDYTATSGTLAFTDGETSKTFTIAIQPDDTFESAEVLRLSLTNPTNGATLGSNATAILTIANDDAPTEAQIQSKTSISTTSGNTTYYIGYNQVATGTDIGNQDPWVASFTNGSFNWYRDDYEITSDDSRGTHLLWDNTTNSLYAAFTSTGTQGTVAEDFRRFATQGWLKSYSDYSPGGGGGAKVAILAKINPLTGDVTNASFLTALNGTKTNSLFVKTLALNGSNLVVQADSAFAPRKPDRTAMTSTGATATSPNYTIEFAPDLGSVISATSTNYA